MTELMKQALLWRLSVPMDLGSQEALNCRESSCMIGIGIYYCREL